MIRRLYQALPGGPAVRTTVMVLIAAAALALILLLYDWLGGILLDSGGSIG